MASGLPAVALVSLVMSSVGFISAVYFVGYGYGLSMVAMGILALRHYATTAAFSQLALYHACMIIAWGVRIFGFLLYRERVAWPGLRERTRETDKKVRAARLFMDRFDCYPLLSYESGQTPKDKTLTKICFLAAQFSLPARISTWLFVSFFYALLFSPALFHLQKPTTIPTLAKLGLGMSAVGLTLESRSDSSKSAFKKENPESFLS
jgi:hypothetical protein